MPTDPEAKNPTTPSGENPVTSPRGASKVENSNVTPEELAKKTEKVEQSLFVEIAKKQAERARINEKVHDLLPVDIQQKSPLAKLRYLEQNEGSATIGRAIAKVAELLEKPSIQATNDIKKILDILEDMSIEPIKKAAYLSIIRDCSVQAISSLNLTAQEAERLKELYPNKILARTAPPPGGTPPATWKIFNETDPRFGSLPNNIREFIRDVNDEVVQSPSTLSDHYLEGLIGDIRRFGGSIPSDVKEEMRRSIDAKTREVTSEEQLRRKTQDESQATRQVTQRFLQSIEPSQHRDYGAIGYEKNDVFFIDYILSDTKNFEDFITGKNFGSQLKTLAEQTPATPGQIIDPAERAAYGYMDFKTVSEAEDPDHYLQRNYATFKKNIRRVFDHLFDSAAINRSSQFRDTQDIYVHPPIRNKINSNLQLLSRRFAESSLLVGEAVKYDYKHKVGGIEYPPHKVHFDDQTSLGEALSQFQSRLSKEADLREYNHNVGFIMNTKGNLEQLAGFAGQLDASQIDSLFVEEENQLLQTAYRFYIQELKKMSADNFWMMGTTWLSEDPQGKVAVEENVKKALLQLNSELTDRDLNRIVSMASGMAFGITGEGLDILAQTQPPHRDGVRGYAGYFGDQVLSYWNIQHTFQRWGTPNHIPELMYLKIMKGGKFGEFWNYKQLEESMKHDRQLLKTGLTWSLSGGPPLIDVASKIWGIKGVLGRGSWRFLALTSHHLVAKPGLPIMQEPYNPNWTSAQGEEWSHNKLILDNINWEESFKNLEKAGVGVMFSYWIDKYADYKVEVALKAKKQSLGRDLTADEKHHIEEHEKDHVKEVWYKKYLEKTRTRNPLSFLRNDLAPSFKESLRWRVLGHMSEFAGSRGNYENIKGNIDEIERDLYLIVDTITTNERWSVDSVDWEKIPEKGGRRDRAKRYWEALQVEIVRPKGPDGKPAHGTIDEVYDKILSSKYYFFGSEDINFQEFAFREGGFDILKRAYNDMNHLSKSVDAFFKYTDVLKAAASGKDYGKIIEAIHEICHPIESIHGPSAAEEMTYYLVTMAARFFGKNAGHRFPLLGGTIMGWLRPGSLSEKVFGKGAWSWDESKTAEFIEAVAGHTGLIPRDKHHWYNIHNLSGEVGARNYQALYDALRSGIPLILLLILWQAIQAEMKDSGGGGGGGGGGGHH